MVLGIMNNLGKLVSVSFGCVLMCSAVACIGQSFSGKAAVGGPVGIFAGSTDVGKTVPGSTVFDAKTKTYQVSGGGADMWGSEDAFRLTWVKLTGDATISAVVDVPKDAPVVLEKAVLIFRQSLDPGSAYADIAVHGDGHATLQFRASAGGPTADTVAEQHGPMRLKIERKGDVFTAWTAAATGEWRPAGTTSVAMHGPVYVGIGMCSHVATGLATAKFSEVKIEAGKK
jgi:hypothetical protein